MLTREKLSFFSPRWKQSFLALLSSKFTENRLISVADFIWMFLSSACTFTILYLIFESRFGSGTKHYPSFLLIGIALYNFFIGVTTRSISAIYTQRELSINTAVPLSAFLSAELVYSVLLSTVEITLCLIATLFIGEGEHGLLWIAPFFLVLYSIFVCSIALVLMLLNSFYYRVSGAWLGSTRLLILLTPIFYSVNSLSPWARFFVERFNPLTPYINSFRIITAGGNVHALFYNSFHALIITLIAAALTWKIYSKIAPTIAEHV